MLKYRVYFFTKRKQDGGIMEMCISKQAWLPTANSPAFSLTVPRSSIYDCISLAPLQLNCGISFSIQTFSEQNIWRIIAGKVCDISVSAVRLLKNIVQKTARFFCNKKSHLYRTSKKITTVSSAPTVLRL